MDIEIRIRDGNLFVSNVPETSWEALKPFWPSLARAVIEVFLEGDFKPYGVRKHKKDGFYAAEWYWNQSSFDPDEYPLKEAERFLSMLLEKRDFVESVRSFNKSRKVDWTSKENIKQLRHFVYKICFPLEDFLKLLKINQ